MNAVGLDSRYWQWRGAAARQRFPEQPGLRFVDVSEAVLRVRVVGEGPATVVIAPDPPNVIEHYGEVIRRLQAADPELRIVCFELPGFGFSFPKRSFSFTLQEMASMICELLEALGVRRATLCFSCLGAFAALLAARRRPDLIDRLVLSQILAFGEARSWTRREDVLDLIKTPMIGQVLLTLCRGLVARQWYRSALPPGAEVAPYLETTLRSLRSGACFCLASAFQEIQRGREPELSGIQQEAIILWGGADRTHQESRKRSILEVLPRARWIELGASGHFPDLENPELFVDFVRGVESPSIPGTAPC